jgi:cell division protein FtsB
VSQPIPSTDSVSSSQPSPPRRPIFRLTNWQIILTMLVIIGGRLVIDFSQRIVEGQQKLGEQRALEAQIADLQAEQKSLEASRIYYNSQAYVEAWAHDQGKMVLDGEILVIPVYQQDSPDTETELATVPSTSAAPTDRPTWQVWWSLFFDIQPPTPQE